MHNAPRFSRKPPELCIQAQKEALTSVLHAPNGGELGKAGQEASFVAWELMWCRLLITPPQRSWSCFTSGTTPAPRLAEEAVKTPIELVYWISCSSRGTVLRLMQQLDSGSSSELFEEGKQCPR